MPRIPVIDIAHRDWLKLNPLSPAGGDSVSIIGWCGIGKEDDNPKQ
jgi:hypothetical protein